MRIEEFQKKIREYREEIPKYRLGQAMFNFVHDQDETLVNKIRGTRLDPYYEDKLINVFIGYLYEQGYLE